MTLYLVTALNKRGSDLFPTLLFSHTSGNAVEVISVPLNPFILHHTVLMLLSVHGLNQYVATQNSTVSQLTSYLTIWQAEKIFLFYLRVPLSGRVKRAEVVQRDCIKSET